MLADKTKTLNCRNCCIQYFKGLIQQHNQVFFFKNNCINQACKSNSCFLNFSSSWRNEISLSCFSEKYEMQSLDVDLRDLFCEPSPFSFLFLVSPHVSSETFCMFFYLHKLLFNFFFSFCFPSCNISFIESLNQIEQCFIYFSVIGCFSGCFIFCSPF